ncbi:hypothetical protein [Alteromonas sp. ASW11-130]|uniref:hypothetical protein n=1 Tax=Alteromonas sp. ASW11-130 TaxID=3015775 RepID=UPI002242258B|nr:hypothetical protein [Alteromonas sp. ASW11-130]MCW8090890.1 hypothetical protein [Alteromonas sp. ASW11-130]
MSKLTKLSILLGTIGIGFSSLTLANTPLEVSDGPFFEDEGDYASTSKPLADGWGWNAVCSIYDTDCDTTGGGGGNPTLTKPGSVEHIFVKYKKGSGSVSLSWPTTSKGTGTDFKYEVYQQPKGGSRSRIYSGTSRSKAHYAGTNKNVRYSVRACNSVGCSGYKDSPYLLINGQFNNDGIATKPLDQKKPQLISPLFLSKDLSDPLRTTATAQDTALSALGAGVDALSGEVYNATCWSTSGTNMLDNIEYVNEQDYLFTQVDTYTQLAETLDIKRSGGLNLSFGGFSVGGSGSSSLYSKTEKVTDTSVIVASFTDEQNKYKAKQASELQMTSDKISYLENGYTKEFRKHCGDRYVDSVTTGRKITFTIRMESTSESNSQIKTKTAELKASLEQYSADGNFDSTERSEIEKNFKGYTFDIKGYQAGADSSSNLLNLNDIGEFMSVLQNFANSSNDALVNINSTDKDYPIPTSMLGQGHFDVFEDYTVIRDKLYTWSNFDSQLSRRCWMLDPNKVGEDALADFIDGFGETYFQGTTNEMDMCQAVKNMVTKFTEYCTNQGEWSKCYQPIESNCWDNNNGSQCLARAERITYKTPTKIAQRLDVARGGCMIGPCYKSEKIDQCFTSVSTVPDFNRNKVISSSYQTGAVRGLTAIIDRAWNVKEARNSVYQNSSGQFCFSAYAKVYGQGGWGSGGRYESNNIMFGFTTRNQGYSL